MPYSKVKNFLSSEHGAFFKAVTGSAGANILALAISMIGSVLLTRALGAEGRGVVTWILALSLFTMSVLQFGMGQASRYFAAEDPSHAGDLAIACILVSAIGSIFIVPLAILYAFSEDIGRNFELAVWIGILSAPLMAIATNLGELLLGLNKNSAFNIHLITQKAVNSAVIIFLIITKLVSPLTAIVAFFVSCALQMLITLFYIRNELRQRLKNTYWIISHMKSYSMANYVANLMQTFSNALIPILLGTMYSLKAAGLYAASIILIDAARSSIRMIGMHALPKLSSTKNVVKRQQLIRHSLTLTLLFGLSAAVFFYLTSSWILPLLFGKEFVESVRVFQLLSFGLIFSVMLNTLQTLITAISRRWRDIVISPLVLAAVTTIVSCLIIPSHGEIGAAIAWAAGWICACLVAAFLYRGLYHR